jgi:hypothetical protein
LAVANLNSPSTSQKDAYKCYTSPGISRCQHGANPSKVIETIPTPNLLQKQEHRFAEVPGKTLQLKAKKIYLSSYVELFLYQQMTI